MFTISIRVGYQDSRAFTIAGEEIPAYMEMLERAFPGNWSISSVLTESPREIDPPVEEVEPADLEDF